MFALWCPAQPSDIEPERPTQTVTCQLSRRVAAGKLSLHSLM